MQYASADERPRQFLNMTEDEMAMVVSQVMDENLKHTLQFGIGLHHAGLNDRDRSLVEELFTNTKIQVSYASNDQTPSACYDGPLCRMLACII